MPLTVPPKRPSQRQRRNKSVTGATLEAGPVTKAALPTRYSTMRCSECELAAWHHNRDGFEKHEVFIHEFEPVVIDWKPLTVAWWETIWASPMADEWVDADVPGLTALASLVDQFWTTGDRGIAGEIRMQQREYGLSPLSRRQLQWEIKRLDGAKPTTPAAPRERARSGRGLLSVLEGRKSG